MTQKDKADAEKEFNGAMSVWYKHDYKNGEKLLGEFAKKYPHSKWRAEAELHQGCYLTFAGDYSKAKPIFERLGTEFAGTNISAKAKLRLGNIAERQARIDEAIQAYTQVLKMNPTWDQFKYANYHARTLVMNRGRQLARIKCGPIALASCLQALGKDAEAAKAREISVTPDGLSLASLESSCLEYGVFAKPVEMTLDELQKAEMPILAFVEPKHFVAVLSIRDGKAQIEDSIRGKYEEPLDQLKGIWAGKVLTFAPKDDMKPLTGADSIEAIGGCCGQIAESECQGCPEDCKSGGYPPGGGDPGGGGPGAGGSGGSGGDNVYTMGGSVGGCPTCGGGMGGGGGGEGNGGSCCGPPSPGSPGWEVNTSNMNLLVTDTPIWYNTGRGYNIAFTLNYSNENSNTGIFGHSWRCVYDMRVFFGINNLQVHRDTGRIETYVLNGSTYVPNPGTANLGYRDKIEILDASQAAAESRTGSPVYTGSVRITRRGGGKYFFMPAGSGATVEGRIYIIEDNVGNRVTCNYTDGYLAAVTDANGGVTLITSNQLTGSEERVLAVTLPSPDGRSATFEYDGDGNLARITDMGNNTSTLVYNALTRTGSFNTYAETTLAQEVTVSPLVPDDSGSGTLQVASTEGFPTKGRITLIDEEMTYEGKTDTTFTGIRRQQTHRNFSSGSWVMAIQPVTTLRYAITETSPASTENLDVISTVGFPDSGMLQIGEQIINYTSKSDTQFVNITRTIPAHGASAGDYVYFVETSGTQVPYLESVETPSKHTQFSYEYFFPPAPLYGLHEVKEWASGEQEPSGPTIHFQWGTITKYPTACPHTSGQPHCSGGLTRSYGFSYWMALPYVVDELNRTVLTYDYNNYGDRTSVTDANNHTTIYDYGNDGKHDLLSITDPLGNTRSFTYYPDHSLQTEKDAYAKTIATYTYNAAGQVTQVDKLLGIQMTYNYVSGRLESSTDARSKTTYYYYNEVLETRGFLTSVKDPENNITSYHYDSKGRRDQVTDPSNNVTKYEYDNLDRVTRTIFGDGANDPFTETKYTCCHKVYDQDENGRRAYYVYDAKVRPYKTITSPISTTLTTGITPTDPDSTGHIAVASVAGLPTAGYVVVLDEIIRYTGLDTTNKWLTGITRGVDTTAGSAGSDDPVGLVGTVQATYGYHSTYLDRMVSLTDALNHTTQYTYYLNGKLETIRYPDDKGERYFYDANNSGPNMVKKEYGTFTGTAFGVTGDLTVNYQYDWNNRLLRTYH